MKTRSHRLLLMFCVVLGWTACDTNDEENYGPPVNGEITCRYTNKFAGQDCKAYIGGYWSDSATREDDCGSGFVETKASIVEEPCPETLQFEGKTLHAIGGCHSYEGTPQEIFVISYEGNLAALIDACDTYMKGRWELMNSDPDGGVNSNLDEGNHI